MSLRHDSKSGWSLIKGVLIAFDVKEGELLGSPRRHTTGGSTRTCITILFIFEGKEYSMQKIDERMQHVKDRRVPPPCMHLKSGMIGGGVGVDTVTVLRSRGSVSR